MQGSTVATVLNHVGRLVVGRLDVDRLDDGRLEDAGVCVGGWGESGESLEAVAGGGGDGVHGWRPSACYCISKGLASWMAES